MSIVPCGANMGHGSSCTEGYLCDSCKRIAELEAQLAKRLAKYMAALDLINELEAQLADMSLICADVRELTNLIVGSPPETPIKGQIESLAFELGHYPDVLNAQEKDDV